MSGDKPAKVVVAMSGGVDSAVAAALLKQQGHEVVGCFMRLGSEETVEEGTETCRSRNPDLRPRKRLRSGLGTTLNPGSATWSAKPETRNLERETSSIERETSGPPRHRGCCSLNDASDARLVAALLGIPFYVFNFKPDFGRIIDYFVAEYHAGRTPNPCIRCNQWLKFGKLAAYARSIDAAFIATGHYARIEPRDGAARLLRGLDQGKDQSYVLFGTPRDMLEHVLLPIGDLHKTEVRRLAKQLGLPVHDKPDSQEICFVPDDDYAGLIERTTPGRMAAGQVLDVEGRVLGEHPGHQHFTIGQRRGVGVARGVPMYVIDKDPGRNTITLGPREALLSAGLVADQTNWLVEWEGSGVRGQGSGDRRQESGVRSQGSTVGEKLPLRSGSTPTLPCHARIRANAQPVPATLYLTGPDTLELRFDQPQPAVSPGQAAVCYDGDVVLGGGWIRAALRPRISDL